MVWVKHLFPKMIAGGFSFPTSYCRVLYVKWLKSYESFSELVCSEWVYNLNFRRTFGTRFFNLLVWEKHLFPKKIGGGFSLPTSYYGLLYVEWLKSYENFSDFGCSEWVYNLNFRCTFGTQLFNLLVWEKHLFPKKIGGGFSYPTWGEVGGSVCPSVRLVILKV